MKVEYNYLPKEFEDVEDIINDWRALIKTTDFTLGQFVADFEEKFKNFIGVKHCISTNNGTDALILSLKSLGIGSGDEVITVANTFYATVGAIVAVGATPVLIDCDDRFQIDPAKIEENITENTKAVIPVHWGGASPEMEKIVAICEKHNLLMIEDACMGIGAVVSGKSPGTFGNVSAFSMHPLKSLNAMGDGGMVVTDDDELAEWMRKYRNHGMVDRDHIEFWGINMRMQPLQCVVLSRGLDRLQQTIETRNRNARILDEGLSSLAKIHVPERIDSHTETFALYMILCEKRDELRDFLVEREIEVKIHYPVPLNKQEAAKENCICAEDLTNVNSQADKLLTIPVHQFLTEEQINYIVESITEFYGREDVRQAV
jgi:dTDP-4-amino-4,6-dideoxygalactose transaminase